MSITRVALQTMPSMMPLAYVSAVPLQWALSDDDAHKLIQNTANLGFQVSMLISSNRSA